MKTFIALVLALTSSGCGYSLAGRGSFLPDYIRVVGIPQLVNNSTFFQVEQILTEKIRTEFIGRGRYTVLPECGRRRCRRHRRRHVDLRSSPSASPSSSSPRATCSR